MREELYASGKCPALAGLLYRMQGEISAGGVCNTQVQGLRKELYLSVKSAALAEVLPGMPVKAGKDSDADGLDS